MLIMIIIFVFDSELFWPGYSVCIWLKYWSNKKPHSFIIRKNVHLTSQVDGIHTADAESFRWNTLIWKLKLFDKYLCTIAMLCEAWWLVNEGVLTQVVRLWRQSAPADWGYHQLLARSGCLWTSGTQSCGTPRLSVHTRSAPYREWDPLNVHPSGSCVVSVEDRRDHWDRSGLERPFWWPLVLLLTSSKCGLAWVSVVVGMWWFTLEMA